MTNPAFTKTLFAKAVAAGDRKADFTARPAFEKIRKDAKARPLESLKPTQPCTAERFRKILGEML